MSSHVKSAILKKCSVKIGLKMAKIFSVVANFFFKQEKKSGKKN